MSNETVESLMNDLIQLDIDASHAYSQALGVIKEKDIRQQLKSFQDDHVRHIKELSTLLKDLGGKPIEKTQDIKGYVIEGFTFLRSITGTEGALKAMIFNEKTTNAKYRDTLEYHSFPQEVRSLITANLQDEKRHLAYIESKVAELQTEATEKQ